MARSTPALFCALAFLLQVAGSGGPAPAERPSLSDLLAKDRYAEALAEAEAQLAERPADRDLALTRARCLFMLGRFRDALSAAETLLREVPERADIRDFRADCLFVNFSPTQAAEAWKPLLEDRRWRSVATKKSVLARMAAGEPEVAEALCAAAIPDAKAAPDDLLSFSLRVFQSGPLRLSALEELAARRPSDPTYLGELALSRSLVGRVPSEVVPPERLPARIRLREIYREPSLKANLEGKRATYLAFDTGCQRMLLNRDVARKLKLASVAKTLRDGWGGREPEEAETVVLSSVALGDLLIRWVPAQVSARDAEFWTDKAGYLGLFPFRPFVSFYDRRGGWMELHPAGTSPRVLLNDPGATARPILWSSGLPLVPASVNGLEGLPFLLDTGAPTTLLDTTLAARLGIKPSSKYRRGYGLGVSGAFTYGVAEGVTVEFAGMRSLYPYAGLTEIPQRFCVPCYGILGRDMLNRFRMVFDGPGGTVTVVPYP